MEEEEEENTDLVQTLNLRSVWQLGNFVLANAFDAILETELLLWLAQLHLFQINFLGKTTQFPNGKMQMGIGRIPQ